MMYFMLGLIFNRLDACVCFKVLGNGPSKLSD